MVSPESGEDFDVRFRAKTEADPSFKLLPEQLRIINDQLKSLERQRSLRQLAVDAARVAEETGSTRQAVIRLQSELVKFGDISLDETRSVVKEFDRLTEAIERSKKAAEETPAVRRGPGLGDIGGETESGLNAVRGLVGSLGVDTSGLGILADFGGALEGLPKLRESLTQLPDAASQAATALGPVGLAGAVGLGALLIASKLYLDSIQDQSAALSRLVASQQEYFNLLERGTTEDARARLEEAQSSLQSLRDQRTEIQSQLDAEFAREQQGILGDLGARIRTAVKTIGDAGEQAAVDRLAELDAAIAKELGLVERLTGGLAENAFAANDAAEAEQALLSARQQATDQMLRLQLQANLEVGNLSADALQERIKSLSAEQQAILEVVRSGEASLELSEQLTQRSSDITTLIEVYANALPAAEMRAAAQSLGDINEKTLQIADAGEKRLTAIREQGTKQIESAERSLAAARKNLTDFEAETRNKRSDAEAEFRKSSLARTDQFYKDLARAQEDGDRRLLELTRNLKDSQFEAELANSTGQFLAAQRQFDRESAQEKENLSVESRRKLEDFNAELERNRQLLQEKLTQIDTEAAKKREALQVEIDERAAALEAVKTDIQSRVEAEKTAIRQSLQNMVSSFDQSAQQMTTISAAAMQTLQNAGIGVASGIVGELRRQAGQLAQANNNPTGTLQNMATAFNRATTPLVRLTGFGEGGIPEGRNIPALLNDKRGYRDVVFSVRESEGIAAGLARHGVGTGGINVHTAGMFAGAKIGGDVSQETLDALEQRVVNGTLKGVRGLVTGKVPA